MKIQTLHIQGETLPCHSVQNLVIGSGAAALNAAVMLHDFGAEDILIITERWGGGTSADAGSDKQTYYKQSLSGSQDDSPALMAEDLFRGGCMHGDIALCEAQHSLEAFFHLVRLGVPFPHNRYGAYIGYRTDHDPRQRATSAGPLTSRMMFEALAREVHKKGIPVLDRHQVVALLCSDEGGKKIIGAAALNLRSLKNGKPPFVIFNAVNVILGTGGPGELYRDSVYPHSQTGSIGQALEIGAAAQNLTESQFGIASTKFKWNLSGTYQQAIPRYFSTDPYGRDIREFLAPFFPDMGTLATAIFLKGYQWPFDPRKIENHGSSMIDLLVTREKQSGRRVFIDFTRNPQGGGLLGDFSLDALRPEAYEYMQKSGALLPAPIERLEKMNPPAITLYRDHGIDLAREPLEIAVCAQHCNGGLKGNIWWESNIRHLFPVGEANGSHGVYRPGGSALNAGQVGSLRAALYIAHRCRENPLAASSFKASAAPQIARVLARARLFLDGSGGDSFRQIRNEIQCRMSAAAGHIREAGTVRAELQKARALYHRLESLLKIPSARYLGEAFRICSLSLTHLFYLEAVSAYLSKGGGSRGSYLVLDRCGKNPPGGMEERWRYSENDPGAYVNHHICTLFLTAGGKIKKAWNAVRPIPKTDEWFENVWSAFRNGHVIR